MIQPEIKDFYKTVFDLTMKVQEHVDDLQSRIQSQTSLVDQADCDYVIFRATELVDDLARRLNRMKRMSEQILCLKYMVESEGGPIKTEYVTASPTMTSMPRIPTKANDPEGYAAFMGSLGCTPEMIEAELFRPHWPSVLEHVAEQAAQGKPLPPGTSEKSTYPVYKVTRRKRKGVLEDE